MHLKFVTIVISILLIQSHSFAQYKPKELRPKGNYTHKATGMIFPDSIGRFKRENVTVFDIPRKNIAVYYHESDFFERTKISVYVYPAGKATDRRFREEYAACLYVIRQRLTGTNTYSVQMPRVLKDNGYIVHGYNAFFSNVAERTSLELYECGDWFFKVRITSSNMDSSAIDSLHKAMVKYFSPAGLVNESELTLKTTIEVDESAHDDSTLLGFTLGCALGKLKWAEDNVTAIEKMAGFPSLYLDMHLFALEKALDFADRNSDMHALPQTRQRVAYLRKLRDAGYLDEFVLEQHNNVMIIPEGKTFDLKQYQTWKNKYPVEDWIYQEYAVVGYQSGK